jgi:hypothetical protein
MTVHSNPTYLPCDQDPVRQKVRAQELQEIVARDQADRTEPVDWNQVQPRDEQNRKRVGEIFGEGCFKTAEDYAAAALVYQHGNFPDHFFQTFLWAKRAVELGDQKQRWLMAAGIDRYLVKSGFKQLFATQVFKGSSDPCWCLEPVEATFPDKLRIEYGKKSLKEALAWVKSLNESHPSCQPAKFCQKNFKNSPAGTVAGFW